MSVNANTRCLCITTLALCTYYVGYLQQMLLDACVKIPVHLINALKTLKRKCNPTAYPNPAADIWNKCFLLNFHMQDILMIQLSFCMLLGLYSEQSKRVKQSPFCLGHPINFKEPSFLHMILKCSLLESYRMKLCQSVLICQRFLAHVYHRLCYRFRKIFMDRCRLNDTQLSSE